MSRLIHGVVTTVVSIGEVTTRSQHIAVVVPVTVGVGVTLSVVREDIVSHLLRRYMQHEWFRTRASELIQSYLFGNRPSLEFVAKSK